MGFFNLFGSSVATPAIEEYLDKGAVVIDVRTIAEFVEGHVEGSKNIPLDKVEEKLEEIKKLGKPVVTCCRSGARSGTAANFLKQQGIDAINGGPWQSVAACKK